MRGGGGLTDYYSNIMECGVSQNIRDNKNVRKTEICQSQAINFHGGRRYLEIKKKNFPMKYDE